MKINSWVCEKIMNRTQKQTWANVDFLFVFHSSEIHVTPLFLGSYLRSTSDWDWIFTIKYIWNAFFQQIYTRMVWNVIFSSQVAILTHGLQLFLFHFVHIFTWQEVCLQQFFKLQIALDKLFRKFFMIHVFMSCELCFVLSDLYARKSLLANQWHFFINHLIFKSQCYTQIV